MLFNEHPTHKISTIVETLMPRSALRYDAMEDVWYHSDMGNGESSLELAPQEARVFVFPGEAGAQGLAAEPVYCKGPSSMELTDWHITYQWANTAEWTEQPPVDLLSFSGVIRYTTAFQLPDDVKRAALHIESAGETVMGELNGHTLPLRMSWPYTWDVGTAVRGSDNVLTLEVATTLVGQYRDEFSSYMALPVPGLNGKVCVYFDTAE